MPGMSNDISKEYHVFVTSDTDRQLELQFKSDSGVEYIVTFTKDGENTFMVFLESRPGQPAFDSRVMKTVCSILEKFIQENNCAVYYVIEHRDMRQRQRSKAFKFSYEKSKNKDSFIHREKTSFYNGIEYILGVFYLAGDPNGNEFEGLIEI